MVVKDVIKIEVVEWKDEDTLVLSALDKHAKELLLSTLENWNVDIKKP